MVLAKLGDMIDRTNKKLHILKNKKLRKERGREAADSSIKKLKK